jgi:hypothetical protein
VQQYVHSLQALIDAGANVRTVVRGRAVGVLSVEMGEGWLDVSYITPASPAEQHVLMSLATPFTVVFDEWPQEVVQRGWHW